MKLTSRAIWFLAMIIGLRAAIVMAREPHHGPCRRSASLGVLCNRVGEDLLARRLEGLRHRRKQKRKTFHDEAPQVLQEVLAHCRNRLGKCRFLFFHLRDKASSAKSGVTLHAMERSHRNTALRLCRAPGVSTPRQARRERLVHGPRHTACSACRREADTIQTLTERMCGQLETYTHSRPHRHTCVSRRCAVMCSHDSQRLDLAITLKCVHHVPSMRCPPPPPPPPAAAAAAAAASSSFTSLCRRIHHV